MARATIAIDTPASIEPAMRGQIIAALSAGASRDAAARAVGSTEADLLAAAGADDEFRAALIAAEARTEIVAVATVGQAARAGDWRAAVYLLEHSHERVPIEAAPACGAKTRAGTPCQLAKGWGTQHKRHGKCRKHGGNTPNGKKAAQVEAARTILADLAIPVAGNPLQVLQAVLDSAHGVMDAARRMLLELPTETDVVDEKAWARVRLYRESIEAAGRMAKLAAEAVNEDALVKLDMKAGEILHRILVAALDAYEAAGPGATGREAAEEAMIRELVAVGPAGDERN